MGNEANELKIEGKYLLQTEGGKYLCDNLRVYLWFSRGFFSKKIRDIGIKARILDTDNPEFAIAGEKKLNLGFRDFILISQQEEKIKLLNHLK